MIQIFDYVAASWIAPPANSNGLNGYSRYSHTSTLTQDGSAVYLLGGWLLNLYNASDAHWLMNANEIWAYDMKSYQWKNITATSTSNVEARWHHTAIAVPNTTWIILYGGYSMVGWSVIPLQSKNQTQTLMIYDWSDNSYKFPNLTNLYYGPPDSQENSGFLYTDPSTKKNYAVYFLGSRNPAVGNPLTSILDISIPTQMTWILNGTSSSSSSSLSGGAIAGIAVGSIAGGVSDS
ncbi:hypothetical protein DM01DRAFT_1188474 [Hesseltinella vesiculosa]|uniref:Galactose oxidase n=1 Tax=Hesseltinella vesiculosa TaxID=101127 RepID=A0A1X2GR86_9FUNG|nr:hypothetical protein DM01DRAFT_1188474 [Hesseltinella vesiculosa]